VLASLLLALTPAGAAASIELNVIPHGQHEPALEAARPEGRQVLRDIDTYLVGINLWYGANRPDARAVDRADIYAFNAIRAQYLGEGGGKEVDNALLLDAARDKFGAARGNRVYTDLSGFDDPETPTTSAGRAPWEAKLPVAGARGLV